MGNKEIKCSIISGAPECDVSFLKKHIDKNSYIICADSGYLHCINSGIKPDLILGDFDSSEQPDSEFNIIKLPAEKDDTDTFCAVKYAVEKGFKEIEIFNAIGNRFDHSYSNMLCLLYCNEHKVNASILDCRNKLTIVNKRIIINNNYYKYFSVFALGGNVCGLSIVNAYYELKNVDISPFSQYTQSNTFNGKDVEITLKSGNLLLVQSND